MSHLLAFALGSFFGGGILFAMSLAVVAGDADRDAEALALESARAPRLKRMDADVVATWAEAGAGLRARGN